MKRFLCFFCLGIFFASAAVSAATRSGARFLLIGAGAREIAMGGAASALSDDVNAVYWNPAGLRLMDRHQWGFTHANLFGGSNFDFAAVGIHGERMSLGFSGTSLTNGTQQGRGENRELTGDFSASDFAFGISGAKNLTRSLGIGTQLKMIQSRIGTDRAQSFALDMGAQQYLALARPTLIGFSVKNLGPGLRFISQKDPLPLTLGLGVGVQAYPLTNVAAEWKYEPNEQRHTLVLGTEYTLASVLSLRAGFQSSAVQIQSNAQQSQFPIAGLVGGFGLRLEPFSIDYAFAPAGDLGNTHRFTVAGKF